MYRKWVFFFFFSLSTLDDQHSKLHLQKKLHDFRAHSIWTFIWDDAWLFGSLSSNFDDNEPMESWEKKFIIASSSFYSHSMINKWNISHFHLVFWLLIKYLWLRKKQKTKSKSFGVFFVLIHLFFFFLPPYSLCVQLQYIAFQRHLIFFSSLRVI